MPKTPLLLHDLNSASGAAFLTLIWEWSITLDDEVEFIWSKPRGAWVKWLYLFARYYPLTASLVARSIGAAVVYNYPMKISCLKIWYSCQVVVALHSMIALEIVLMTRVYALYNRPRWMRLFFTSLVIIENVIVMTGLFVHFPWPNKKFLPIFLATKLPPSFSYFGFCTIIIQVVILYFTLLKYLTGNWKTVPIVKLMFRDGTLSFTVLTIFSTSMSVLTVLNSPYAVPGYAWLLTSISSVTCRLIINLQQLPRENPDISTGIQFTTFFPEETTTPSRLTRNVSSQSSCQPTSSSSISQVFDPANANRPENRNSSSIPDSGGMNSSRV